VGAAGAFAIADALRANRVLSSLVLRGNDLPGAVAELGDGGGSGGGAARSLVDACDALGRMLRSNATLTLLLDAVAGLDLLRGTFELLISIYNK